MKKTIRVLALVVALVSFSLTSAFAEGMANCTINNAGSNNSGQTWINVTDANNQSYNLLFPSTYANSFLATALTALSIGKKVNLDVTAVSDWAGVNAMVVAN